MPDTHFIVPEAELPRLATLFYDADVLALLDEFETAVYATARSLKN
jgi:hypothetical protein